MDKAIPGDKYIHTLSHYLRTNQCRLLPSPAAAAARPDPNSSSVAANARAIVNPLDPMASVYSGMVNSLWNVTSAVVSSISPSNLSLGLSSTPEPTSPAQEIEAHKGSWDGTGAILYDPSPVERQLQLQAQLRAPVFPLDLYYLLYLLERFEEVGIEFEDWDGLAARSAVRDATPRAAGDASGDASPAVAGTTIAASNNSGALKIQMGATTAGPTSKVPTSPRPQSIRSFSSTAISTLTLITGWKQWSTAASNSTENLSVTDDIHFIHKFFRRLQGLRLVAKISPGSHNQDKGRIEDFDGAAILTLFNHGFPPSLDDYSSDLTTPMVPPMLLPLATSFSSLTHLELHKIPANCVDGWETLMPQLRSLVLVQARIEDLYDIVVTAVVNGERRRRARALREKNRAVQIKQEQEEALKDAALETQRMNHTTSTSYEGEDAYRSTHTNSENGVGKKGNTLSEEDENLLIIATLKMWPILRHLSISDNSLPSITRNEAFHHIKSVVSLDLSHNLLLAPPSGLIHLYNLNELNLSYNMISGVQSIYQILGNIAILDLRGNRLESLSGLERLWNLEKVDIRENYLSEAAEVGRLAALPGVREVWTERNPFCTFQPKYRLEILAVFKANGHDLLLDGTFASFTERRALSNLSPSAFSAAISGVTNPANDQADTAKAGQSSATLGNKITKKKLIKSAKRVERVVNLDSDHEEEGVMAADELARFQEGVMSDGEELPQPLEAAPESPSRDATKKKKKKKSTKSSSNLKADAEAQDATASASNGKDKDKDKEKVKKRISKKKSGVVSGVSFAGDTDAPKRPTSPMSPDFQDDPEVDHSLCRGNHHVHRHRLAQLEESLAAVQLERPMSGVFILGTSPTPARPQSPSHARQPSRGILKKHSTFAGPSTGTGSNANPGASGAHTGQMDGAPYDRSGAISPRLRPSSPIGSFSSDDGGADGYRRRIEAMRSEAGSNWLKVLAEMDRDPVHGTSTMSPNF
ncbi:hypothetical protein BGW38_004304 [Lunasporangiospora selenospora]|uniref:Leucine rich repeat-containing protein n=1 Tax=Lunasporangiospora selenospora TaxID=979761 RepID=A0A9P6KHE7_9FUNG|nr:hypothetical protein BGW38_004304 [Lunasporangiospora selenospora]